MRISDKDHIQQEKEHLWMVFRRNGYLDSKIDEPLEKLKRDITHTKEGNNEENHKVFLPYVQGTTYRIAHLLKKKNIRTIFAPPNNLRKLLSAVKDPISPRSHKGMYQIPCTCGKTYIGET
jgi:hypothetical protein